MGDCRDGVVGIDEFLFVLANWGPCDEFDCLCEPDIGPPWPADLCRCCEWGDINRDHVVDIYDLLLVIQWWGPFDNVEWLETRCHVL